MEEWILTHLDSSRKLFIKDITENDIIITTNILEAKRYSFECLAADDKITYDLDDYYPQSILINLNLL